MKNKINWKIWVTVLAALVGGLAIWTGWSAYCSATQITVTEYKITAGVTESIRIVQLTDLHGKVFGDDNGKIVQMVSEQDPDLILMTGDMLDKTDENADVVCSLIQRLVQTAPVYYGYGNHEMDWIKQNPQLGTALAEAGATVVNCGFVDVDVNGQALRIGGYYNYYRQPHMYPLTAEEKLAEIAFADEFEDTGRYKILLSHIPTAWLDWGYIDRFPVDLVLSGHYHGGQIVLPGIGGLYAPYIGLFPYYTEGMFEGEQAVCILSAGLGSSPGIPRINNLPEIVVAELTPEK